MQRCLSFKRRNIIRNAKNNHAYCKEIEKSVFRVEFILNTLAFGGLFLKKFQSIILCKYSYSVNL